MSPIYYFYFFIIASIFDESFGVGGWGDWFSNKPKPKDTRLVEMRDSLMPETNYFTNMKNKITEKINLKKIEKAAMLNKIVRKNIKFSD